MTENRWTVFHALLETLPDYEKVLVQTLQAQATSYVWGWQDAGTSDRDTSDSIEFGYAYGIHAAEFAAHKRFSRVPIQDAFKAWRDGRTIGDYPTPAYPTPAPITELKVGDSYPADAIAARLGPTS